jgi:BCD family chlorophyll transporter-like MFS transporter
MSKAERHPLTQFTLNMLPFSNAGSEEFELRQLMRLSLFQVSVGMATVMLLGTLNRVMIVELGVPAFVVALMVALPVLIAPFRALLGFRSDTYRSAIGWKRIPYLWFGSLWQFGGLALMPFALIVLSGGQVMGPTWAGEVLAAIAFLMTGLGIHMTQTAGLALASDRSTPETQPRVVALLYVMFLVGMAISSVIIGFLLANFSETRLVQVVQGTAVVTLLLNLCALWKQESMRPTSKEERAEPKPKFADAWRDFTSGGSAGRLLCVVAFGTAGFQAQDVLLEPYGGEILGLSVSTTTLLTAVWALGAIAGFWIAARWLIAGMNPYRMAARGILIGITALSMIIFADPLSSTALFFVGTTLIGLGSGLFAVSMLTSAMAMPVQGSAGRGLALGAWGAAQATALGLATIMGGGLRDIVNALAVNGHLGEALASAATGYSVVYHIEIGLLFITLIVLGPLVRTGRNYQTPTAGIGLADYPA